MQYLSATVSRIGNRKTNQDRVRILNKGDTVFLILADGLGGRPGGEFAAQTLINCAHQIFDQQSIPIKEPMAFMQKVLETAHQSIVEEGAKQNPSINPGSTAVLCLIQQGNAWWTHVGDSRLYLFRTGQMIERTQDHSVVENMLAGGQLSSEDSNKHPLRNVITRCLGLSKTPPSITFSPQTLLKAGDIILLCSDGFWEPLNEKSMSKRLFDNKLNDALQDMAIQAEKISAPQSDNTSAVAIQVMSLTLRTHSIGSRKKIPQPNLASPRNKPGKN